MKIKKILLMLPLMAVASSGFCLNLDFLLEYETAPDPTAVILMEDAIGQYPDGYKKVTSYRQLGLYHQNAMNFDDPDLGAYPDLGGYNPNPYNVSIVSYNAATGEFEVLRSFVIPPDSKNLIDDLEAEVQAENNETFAAPY